MVACHPGGSQDRQLQPGCPARVPYGEPEERGKDSSGSEMRQNLCTLVLPSYISTTLIVGHELALKSLVVLQSLFSGYLVLFFVLVLVFVLFLKINKNQWLAAGSHHTVLGERGSPGFHKKDNDSGQPKCKSEKAQGWVSLAVKKCGA